MVNGRGPDATKCVPKSLDLYIALDVITKMMVGLDHTQVTGIKYIVCY